MTADVVFAAEAAWLGGAELSGPVAVHVRNATILDIAPPRRAPAGPERVELDGALVPGIVDGHVHITLSEPDAVLRGGVTSVRDLGGDPDQVFDLARRSSAVEFDGPSVSAAGPLITAPGGYPTTAAWAPDGFALELGDPARAPSVVADLVGRGAAIIKLAFAVARGPTLDDATAAAVCDAAHARGVAVTAHVEGAGETERALRAGVDELAHTPWTERLDHGLIGALAERVTFVSTLRIHAGRALDVALDNLRAFRARGGRVRYGTDLPNEPIRPRVDEGEIEHLAGAGLSGREILAAATAGPLRAGIRADMVTVNGDPLADPRRLAEVGSVVRAGRVRV